MVFIRPTSVYYEYAPEANFQRNASLLFHEFLHDITGLIDHDIQVAFGIMPSLGNTSNISDYIAEHVFSSCPSE